MKSKEELGKMILEKKNNNGEPTEQPPMPLLEKPVEEPTEEPVQTELDFESSTKEETPTEELTEETPKEEPPSRQTQVELVAKDFFATFAERKDWEKFCSFYREDMEFDDITLQLKL